MAPPMAPKVAAPKKAPSVATPLCAPIVAPAASAYKLPIPTPSTVDSLDVAQEIEADTIKIPRKKLFILTSDKKWGR